jgi:hypothetical protein
VERATREGRLPRSGPARGTCRVVPKGRSIFGVHRLRSDACGHGSGPLKDNGSQKRSPCEGGAPSFARRPSRAARVGRVSISAPIRPITSRTGGNFVSRPKFRPPSETPSRARSSSWHPPPSCISLFRFVALFCGGDVVATARNNTQIFFWA